MSTLCIPDEVAARGAKAVGIYKQVIASGETERFALMCAMQCPPGSRNTDRAFCEGQRRKMERMNPKRRKDICEIAQKAGIQTDGKFFMGGLGGYTNPAAWVSCAEDVFTSCKVQNKGVEGVLNMAVPKMLDVVPPKPVPLAPELVAEMSQKEMKADPALAEKCKKSRKARGELREKVIHKYGKRRR